MRPLNFHRTLRIAFSLVASATALAVPLTTQAPAGTLAEYGYTAPQGWTTANYPDGIVLTSPGSATGEHCLISMWPMRPAGQNLLRDADTIFQQIFNTYEARNQTSRGTPLLPSVIQGLSGQGWEYLILKRGIGKPLVVFGFAVSAGAATAAPAKIIPAINATNPSHAFIELAPRSFWPPHGRHRARQRSLHVGAERTVPGRTPCLRTSI